jgi:hypothetical protein
VALGRVVPRERLDLGRTKREGLIERRFEITVVRGEDHEVDVGPLSFADHSERTKDVDALLTLALDDLIPVSTEEQTALTVVLVAILQRSVSDSDPLVALPMGLLSLVARVRLGVVLNGGLSAVDKHAGQDGVIHPGPLGAVASDDQLVPEVHGVDQRLVAGKVLADSEQFVRGEVHVLVVHHDDSLKIRHRF